MSITSLHRAGVQGQRLHRSTELFCQPRGSHFAQPQVAAVALDPQSLGEDPLEQGATRVQETFHQTKLEGEKSFDPEQFEEVSSGSPVEEKGKGPVLTSVDAEISSEYPDFLTDFPEGEPPSVKADSPKGVLEKMHYTFGASLGEGAFGAVQVVKAPSGNAYAFKAIPKEKAVGQEHQHWFFAGSSERGEALAAQFPKHDNLLATSAFIVYRPETDSYRYVDVKDLSLCTQNEVIVGTLAEIFPNARELFECIVESTSYPNLSTVKKVGRQIAAGGAAMHAKGLIHRDLKPENVLIDPDQNVKLIDYGLSRHLEENGRTKTVCGSPTYVAPEVILGKGYDHKIDSWSFGMVLFAMAFQTSPFPGDTIEEVIGVAINFARMLKGHSAEELLKSYLQLPDVPKEVRNSPSYHDPQFWDLVNQLLCKPKERFSLAEALEHPFFGSQ